VDTLGDVGSIRTGFRGLTRFHTQPTHALLLSKSFLSKIFFRNN